MAAHPPKQEALRPGQRVGPCEIIEPLASGGSASAYLAKRDSFPIPVVLKACPSTEVRHAEILIAEGRYLYFLNAEGNPHVPMCLDYGENNGWTYIAMERVEGDSFRFMIDFLNEHGATFPLETFFHLSNLACDGFDAISNLGTEFDTVAMHRDIKPEHLIHDRKKNSVRFVDFGLGAVEFAEPAMETRKRDGLFRGTPAYAAEETWLALPDIDERADIYSFGILSFELLTGHRPFEAETINGLLQQHLNTPLPDTGRAKPVQKYLERMTAKDRNQRPAH